MKDKRNEIKTIWVSGLSSSGKTTLAQLIVKKLKNNGYPALLIDGNETRDLFKPKLGFDPMSRRKQTNRVKDLAIWVIKQNIIPVVAIIHPFEDDRWKCRNGIPNYYEVYLKCDIEECVRRDNKGVYLQGIKGNKCHIVGLDIIYEDQKNADLILESDKYKPDQLLEFLWGKVSKIIYNNRF